MELTIGRGGLRVKDIRGMSSATPGYRLTDALTRITLLAEDVLRVDFRLADEVVALRGLMLRFAHVPMSFADACLVRMTELDSRSSVLTLDGDFKIYRRNRRQAIPALMPQDG